MIGHRPTMAAMPATGRAPLGLRSRAARHPPDAARPAPATTPRLRRARLTAATVTFRRARPEDAAAIAAIWNREVLETVNTTDTEPRDLAQQRAWLAQRSEDHPVVVAVIGGEVVGYASLSPYRPKPAFRRTVEDSVYVEPGARGQGIGGRLLSRLLAAARARGHHAVIARITGDNTASIRVHERAGFVRVGRERETAWKHGRWHDVVLLELLVEAATRKRDAP